MTSAKRMEVLKLYKMLLRESSKFPTYNFREYAVNRVKAAFREHSGITNSAEVDRQLADGYKNLEVIKRQVIIGHMFGTDRLVIEKKPQ